jgi:hypothetical protein
VGRNNPFFMLLLARVEIIAKLIGLLASACFLTPVVAFHRPIESKKGSAVSRGALMLGVIFYASVITGMAPAESGTCTDTA